VSANRRFSLNWSPIERETITTHSSHFLETETPLSPHHAEDIFEDLRNFAHFDGGHNSVAVVYCRRQDGVEYAMFHTGHVFGLISSFVNDVVVAVRLGCQPGTTEIQGDTCHGHMLVGQRRWRVVSQPHSTVILTEAFERPHGRINRFGMRLLGRYFVSKIWSSYLRNIQDALDVRATLGVAEPDESKGNPWEPRDPYTACNGKI
jgi:hypothetical protein